MSLSKKASIASCDEFFTCQSLDPSELREAFPNLVFQTRPTSSSRLSVSNSASANVSRHNSNRSVKRGENHSNQGDQRAARVAKRTSTSGGQSQAQAQLQPGGDQKLRSFDSNDSLKSSRDFYSLPDSSGYASAPVRRIEPLFERTTLRDFLIGFLRFLAAFFLLLLFGLLMCFVAPVAKLCRFVAQTCYSRRDGRTVALSTFEAIWFPDLDALTFDRAVVQCFLLIDDRIELAHIRELLQTRLLNARLSIKTLNRSRFGSDCLLYPRYTEKLVTTWLGYAWKTDERFSIANHLHTVPSVRNRSQLNDYFSTISRAPLDRERPLWQVHVAYLGERETALIIRIHPALAEPLELVHVLCNHPSMLQDQTLTSHLIGNTRSRWDALRAFTKRAVCAFWTPYFFIAHFSLKCADSNMLHGNVEPRIDNMQVRCARAPLRDLNKLLSLTNADCNEMYFALLAGAVRAYEQFYGLDNPFDHTALLNIESAPFAMWLKRQTELRANASKLRRCHHSNFFCEMRLPSNTEACLPRLWTVQYRDAPQSYDVRMYLRTVFECLFMLLPSKRFSRLVNAYYEKATCTIAYQHGSESALMLGSREIRELIVWQTPPRNLSTSAVFTNYAGYVSVAVCADQRILPNIELLLRAIQNQIDILTEQLARKKTFSDDEMLIEGKPRSNPVKNRVTLASIEARLRRLSEDPHEVSSKSNIAEMTNEDIQNVLESIQTELDAHEQASAVAKSDVEKAAIDRRVQNLRQRFQMVIHETVKRNRVAAGPGGLRGNYSNNRGAQDKGQEAAAAAVLTMTMANGNDQRNTRRGAFRADVHHTEVDLDGTMSPRPPSVVLTTHDEEVIELSGYDFEPHDVDNSVLLRGRRRSSSLPFLANGELDESGFASASAQRILGDTPQFSSLMRPLRPVSANDNGNQPLYGASDFAPHLVPVNFHYGGQAPVTGISPVPMKALIQNSIGKAPHENVYVKLANYKLMRRSTAPL